jgi:hypothetical protein
VPQQRRAVFGERDYLGLRAPKINPDPHIDDAGKYLLLMDENLAADTPARVPSVRRDASGWSVCSQKRPRPGGRSSSDSTA